MLLYHLHLAYFDQDRRFATVMYIIYWQHIVIPCLHVESSLYLM